ncbi:MAG: PAS domain S-box protein [Acidobacteria bacterium]|nr:MAG: PAS domain S-box protein [Acidobacteriota bacterium]
MSHPPDFNDDIIRNMAEGIVVQDADGRIAFVNPAAAALLGYGPGELLGRSWTIVTPVDQQDTVRVADDLRARGAWSRYELELLHRTGRRVPVVVSGCPIFAGEARKGTVAVFTDMTDLKEAERRTRRQEARNATIYRVGQRLNGLLHLETLVTEVAGTVRDSFDCHSVTLFLGDGEPGGLHVAASAGDEGAGGARADPLDPGQGRPGMAWSSGQTQLSKSADAVAVPIRFGGQVIGVLDLLRRAGDPFEASDIAAIDTLATHVAAAIANARLYERAQQEIAERRQSEERLRQATEELTRSNKELELFAYVASHDLQEPLRMIGSYVQLLARRYSGKLDEDADEFIGFAVDGASRMQRIINDLLAYSRVGTKGRPFLPTDLEQVWLQATANLQVTIEERAAVLTHDPLPTVSGDEPQFIQLFQNLLGNAVKFCPAPTTPEVHLSCREEDGRWVFSLRDNGIGIDPQYFERIFQIFQRLHDRTQFPGTGIGLALCRKIVERHGGGIRVESEPGRGATFIFTIPRKAG